MGIVVARVEPVSIHCCKILNLELDQAFRKVTGVSQFYRKGIRLIFKLPRENVDEQLENRIERLENVVEEKKPNEDWLSLVKSECLVERSVVYEGREKSEDVKEMELESITL